MDLILEVIIPLLSILGIYGYLYHLDRCREEQSRKRYATLLSSLLHTEQATKRVEAGPNPDTPRLTLTLMDANERKIEDQVTVQARRRPPVVHLDNRSYHASRQDAEGNWIYRRQ